MIEMEGKVRLLKSQKVSIHSVMLQSGAVVMHRDSTMSNLWQRAEEV